MDSEGPREEKENGCSSEMEQKKVGLMREMVEREDPTSKVYSFLPYAFFFFSLFLSTQKSIRFTLTMEKNNHHDPETGHTHRLNGQDFRIMYHPNL